MSSAASSAATGSTETTPSAPPPVRTRQAVLVESSDEEDLDQDFVHLAPPDHMPQDQMPQNPCDLEVNIVDQEMPPSVVNALDWQGLFDLVLALNAFRQPGSNVTVPQQILNRIPGEHYGEFLLQLCVRCWDRDRGSA